MRGTVVGGEVDDDAAFFQCHRKRFGGKQMPAGAAGRQQHKRRGSRRHYTRLPTGIGSGAIIEARGCSRVNASSMPIA